jgi:LmbE family N-acetylglucosaminyl deacetylase
MWSKNVAIIVAHPDDETLWAGGTILSHPSWKCFVACLCRANDTDRSTKFFKALKVLKQEGLIGDVDDGPEQFPLEDLVVENAILDLLPAVHFDLIISHNPNGEYTRHLRHEEVSKAVIELWNSDKVSTDELWTFAYEDGGKAYYPRPIIDGTICHVLPHQIWQIKHDIITEMYGFAHTSWEAQTTPRTEAFWQFKKSNHAIKWLNNGGILK